MISNKADYKLSEASKTDLQNIYRYGFHRFGEQQAEKYYSGLILCLSEIAKNPLLNQRVPEVGVGYHRYVYISESIYYRIVKNQVEIMAIIRSQDASSRI